LFDHGFVHVLLDLWLKKTNFLGKEKEQTKKESEYKVVFRLIQGAKNEIKFFALFTNISFFCATRIFFCIT